MYSHPHAALNFRWAAALAVGVSLLFVALPARAATGLTIQPVRIDETMNPGDVLRGEITITNASDGPADVEESIQDFIPTAGADAIQFVGRAPGVTSVRDWINVEGDPTFTLTKDQGVNVPYTITAPANAEPGSHFGVVLFKATPSGGDTGSLKVGTQVGMLVLITIPGNHLEKGQILDFSAPKFLQSGPVPFNIKFENTGTVHFEPKGSIVVTNLLGVKVAEIPITGQVVLPTSVRTLSFTWQTHPLAIGRYTAVASIQDGDGNILTSETTQFWIIPVWYIVGFLVVLVLIYMFLRYLKRHLRVELR